MSETQSAILDRLKEDIKQAMRDQAKELLAALRILHANIKQKEIDQRPAEGITDNDIIQVINSMLKQRRESAAQYHAANRPELAAQEENEIAIYQKYLPEQLSQAEINELIDQAIAETQASDLKSMGQVMGYLKLKLQGRADIGAVSKQVNEKLSSNP